MQHADQREQAPRGVEIDVDLALEPLHQDVRTFVVQPAPAHVERLDAVGRGGADRLVVAVADHVVVLHEPPQRRERQQMRDHRRAVLAADVEHQPAAGDAQVEREGPLLRALRREAVLLDEVVDRDRALVLDVRVRAPDRALVERHRDQAVRLFARRTPPSGHSPLMSPVGALLRIGTLVGIEAHRHGAGMGIEPFRLAERDRGGAERAQLVGPAFEDRGALHEIEHAEAGREAGGARGRQHVVRAADIVANCLGRVCPEKDRAGIADAAGEALGIGARDLEVLGRDRIDQRHGIVERGDVDDGAEIAPGGGGDRCTRQRRKLRGNRLLHRIRERGIVGDQDRLGAGVMLGLRQEIAGDPVGMAALVGEDQDFRGARDHVDADPAEDQALGGRHIGIAGADDLGDRRDALRAVGERRHRLCPADAVDFVDAGELRRRQHQGRELAVRRRHHHHQPRNARHLGGDGIHQHG